MYSYPVPVWMTGLYSSTKRKTGSINSTSWKTKNRGNLNLVYNMTRLVQLIKRDKIGASAN